VALVYLGVTAVLEDFTRTAEASGVVYPYKHEDWLRYLVPSLWRADGKPLMLLAGPSTVRENLLVEEFADAFPEYRVYQGGISAGTLGDALAALRYVEKSYGAKALPRTIVLGVSPRFIAELPAQDRPFEGGLRRYSPYFRMDTADTQGGLERKNRLLGLLAYGRFHLTKQQGRYNAALHWYIAQAIPADFSNRLRCTAFMNSGLGRLLFSGRARTIGIREFALELASPYKYHSGGNPLAANLEFLDTPDSKWREVFAWDAGRNTRGVGERIAAMMSFARTHGIELYVVNLPEASANRIRYQPGNTEHYLALLNSAFAPAPVLDLRCLLRDDEFLDAEHARYRGAKRITARAVGFMRDVRSGPVPPDNAVIAKAARKWQADVCFDLLPGEPEKRVTPGRSGPAREGLAAVARRGQ